MSELIPVAPSLAPEQFRQLSDAPPELEWLANIANPKTRRAYKVDVAEFKTLFGLTETKSLRSVARSHVIAWRKDMEVRSLAPTSIRPKLSALSSLFDYLCERNAVLGNPVNGVRRPASNNKEGSTPALGDAQARRLLGAPASNTLKGVRDPRNPALSRHPARGAVPGAAAGYSRPPGSHAFPREGQARQD